MTEQPKKKGFWSSLFRSRNNAQSSGGPSRHDEYPRSTSDGDLLTRRPRTEEPDVAGTRRRPRRPDPRDSKGKGREQLNGHAYEQVPLTEWPPSGISAEEELTLGQAMELISRGVPMHRGHKRPITHASDHYYGLYATTAGNHGEEGDTVNQHNAMTQLMSLRVQGSGPPTYPWETLEQPSVAFGVGARPGTITLNSWVARSSVMPPMIALRDPGTMPREVDLVQIFERLKDLEAGLEDDDPELMYQQLYKRFLRDPDKISNPHKHMEQQITDLVMCLSGLEWFDLTNPKNQVVTKFIYDTSAANHGQYLKFFYQLLLSLELELRINSRMHTEWAKERLVGQIPPKIQWNLALARRWRENIRVEEYGATAEHVRLRYKLRKRQTKMLKRFAQMMKWSNLPETLDVLKERDADGSMLAVSSHAMAFFSGLVLPGPTFPFLMMNSLIDIDPDEATNNLALLSHMNPNCGFQYHGSYTYWTSTSIVGKVLAPTCLEVAGWVGPARPTTDLGRSQMARIRSRRPRQRMTPEDVATMSERCDPLGPTAEVYPVREYDLLTPDSDNIVDTVRIEMLTLKQIGDIPEEGSGLYDASIQFAISGVSWPLHLIHDVCFIHAWPCSDGPHPLFFDYVHTTVRADEVMGIQDWLRPPPPPLNGSGSLKERSTMSTPVGGSGSNSQQQQLVRSKDIPPQEDDDAERVLVVEAFGVKDNEVLVRAWCAHWGLSAIVADIGKTCMACAIREAYAATLTVVILIEEQPDGMD
ncbi:putative tpr domain-containing protein [Rosellinia necatrix]|uniref:Putative tpr domain-containing protein n=1 Tax=Rosellinia necatrix TaxID=77044 RepID=A0A1W2TIH5_ROSNE|nr:putative tpr domain-containing protein [Rosellinia necatrix]